MTGDEAQSIWDLEETIAALKTVPLDRLPSRALMRLLSALGQVREEAWEELAGRPSGDLRPLLSPAQKERMAVTHGVVLSGN